MNLLSVFDVSLETANKFYSWGWKASLFGAAITLIGVSLLMWGTRVRDHDFETNMSQLNAEAAKANERAAQLESEAAKAKEKTARLEVETAKTKEAEEEAKERAATAEIRAAEAKLELAKFKAPRMLTEKQKIEFIKSLDGAPKGKFVIMFKFADDESRLFAMQIRDLLLSAGYSNKDPSNNMGWFQNDEPRKGVAIRIGNVERQPPYAGALQRAFESIGIEPLIQLGSFEMDVVDIKIGSKP